MDNQIKSKRRKRQKQANALINNFADKYASPTVRHWGRLFEHMLRKCKGMTPTLMEDLILLKRPEQLKELVGEDHFPQGQLLYEEFFFGLVTVKDGVAEKRDGVRINDIIQGTISEKALLRPEDLEALAYAIAYVLGGPETADLIPCYDNPKISENRQSQERTSKPAKR